MYICVLAGARCVLQKMSKAKKMSNYTVSYEHKSEIMFIGFSRIFRSEEGYRKCPEFWDEFNLKFSDLWKTQVPGNDVEKAVLENNVGMFAVCVNDGDKEFEYLIAGLYHGGAVPEGMKVFTYPESDWAVFSTKGTLPSSLQTLNTYVWESWLPSEGVSCKADTSIDVEYYSMGNPQSDDYESGIWMPVKGA